LKPQLRKSQKANLERSPVGVEGLEDVSVSEFVEDASVSELVEYPG